MKSMRKKFRYSSIIPSFHIFIIIIILYFKIK